MTSLSDDECDSFMPKTVGQINQNCVTSLKGCMPYSICSSYTGDNGSCQ